MGHPISQAETALNVAGDTGRELRATLTKPLPGFVLDVTISVPPGSILVLVGPSGSGKTTLLRCLAGLERPSRGRVELAGRTLLDTARGIYEPARRRGVGLVFQDHPLFPHMTLLENVSYAATSQAFARDLLELFGIAHLANRKPPVLSGGERQRGAICQALAARPRALLLDEPFSALDPRNRLRLRQELRGLMEMGGALGVPVVHVTHDLAEALALGDQILAIDRGLPSPDWFRDQLALVTADAASLATRDSGISPTQRPTGHEDTLHETTN